MMEYNLCSKEKKTTRMFNYIKSIEYHKILIIILCLIGVVSLIILAIYFGGESLTSGCKCKTHDKFLDS